MLDKTQKIIAVTFGLTTIFWILVFLFDVKLDEVKVGYSDDGRRWVLEKKFGTGIGERDLVYEIDSDGNKIGEGMRYKSSILKGEERWMVNGESRSMTFYIPDDSRIQICDSLIVDFRERKGGDN